MEKRECPRRKELKVKDRVKVVKKVDHWEAKGIDYKWIPAMDILVGETGIVISTTGNNFIQVFFDFNMSDYYLFRDYYLFPRESLQRIS